MGRLVLIEEDDLRRIVAEAVRENAAGPAATPSTAEDGLHPDYAYSSKDAAKFLGVEPASVAKISRQLLPRVRSGRFLGVDILAYRGDVSARDAAAYKDARLGRIRAAAADDGRPPLRSRASR